MTGTVHATADEETAGLEEFYPPHPPRSETGIYRHTHDLLVHHLDSPCRDCGVRQSTLTDPAQNPFGATQIETHHYPLQREFADALDPAKVGREFPQVTDRRSLNLFIDSPANMLVLCDVDHRSPTRGIHHVNAAIAACKRFLLDGYIIAGLKADEAADLAADAAIVAAAHEGTDQI